MEHPSREYFVGPNDPLSTETTAVSRSVFLPSRADRVAALRELLGRPERSVGPLAVGIRSITHRAFDQHVLPLVRLHWPAVLGTGFYEKLRIGTCDLYASAPYTALFCAPRRPLFLRLVTDVGNALPLPKPVLAHLGEQAIRAMGRFGFYQQHRRIVLIGAFIVVVDHVFDHCMEDAPLERGARLEKIIDGIAKPDRPELALVQALAFAMGQDLEGEEQVAFDAAMLRVKEWIRAEVKAMRGEPDPKGLGHRLAGVEGTIDGLLFPVVKYAGEGARRWMYDVSYFVQVADDWLDYEMDLQVDRSTPIVTGDWTFRDVETAWKQTIVGIEALVREAGLSAPHYVAFVRDAYVLMMFEVMEAMIQRPTA